MYMNKYIYIFAVYFKSKFNWALNFIWHLIPEPINGKFLSWN